MSWKPNKIERVEREIIESQILMSLSEGDKVAMILTEGDLNLVLFALDRLANSPALNSAKALDMAKDLRQLKEEAFG